LNHTTTEAYPFEPAEACSIRISAAGFVIWLILQTNARSVISVICFLFVWFPVRIVLLRHSHAPALLTELIFVIQKGTHDLGLRFRSLKELQTITSARYNLWNTSSTGESSLNAWHQVFAELQETHSVCPAQMMTNMWETQAVSRRLTTAAARVRARIISCGICGGQSGIGASFLLTFRFPLFRAIAPHSSLSPRAGTMGGLSNSGPGFAPVQ
jgi:hypothetical protein